MEVQCTWYDSSCPPIPRLSLKKISDDIVGLSLLKVQIIATFKGAATALSGA